MQSRRNRQAAKRFFRKLLKGLRYALRKAISSDAVCIGEFQVSGTGRISLAEQNAIRFQLAKLRR